MQPVRHQLTALLLLISTAQALAQITFKTIQGRLHYRTSPNTLYQPVGGEGQASAPLAVNGDVLINGSTATLPTVNANTGSYGSATAIPVLQVNAKGQVIGITTVPVAPQSLTLVSGQLYNKADANQSANQNKYIDNQGNLTADVNNSVSSLIPVTGSTWYTPSYITFLTYYNGNTVIGGEMYNRATAKFQTPFAATHIRITVPNNLVTTFMLNKGEELLPYEEYGTKTSNTGALAGKRILWLGTSIPKLSGYPEAACTSLGAVGINNAVASSSARRAKKNGSVSGMSWNAFLWNLSSTTAEIQTRITNYATYRDSLVGGDKPATLTQAQKDFALSCSYQNLITPFLSGTATVDLIVFNHNFNDGFDASETISQFASIPSDSFDRNTYVGAINYLIRYILSINPRQRIAFVSHYENQVYPQYAKADSCLSSYWGYPLLKLYDKTGWTKRLVPNTLSLWSQPPWSQYGVRTSEGEVNTTDMTMKRYAVPDGVHPNTDPTGKSPALLTRLCALFLSGILFMFNQPAIPPNGNRRKRLFSAWRSSWHR